jgi:FAS-associated factor 2
VSNSLGAEGFPFLAVVSTSAEGIYLQARFVGFVPADRLLQGLSTITDDYASAQAAQSMANEERDQARRLREEQDAAYRAAEQADMQRRAQERAAAEERRKKEEEERRAAEARAKLSQSRQQRVAEWRERSAGYDASKSEYCMIRLRLPSGAVQGVFKQEDTMALVYDVARVEGQIDDATHFALCTNLPPAEISSNVLVKDASGGSRQLQLFFKEQ